MKTPTDDPLPSGVRAVLDFLDNSGFPYTFHKFDSPTQHATEAAALLGCPLAAVVKSLVFQIELTGEMVLALVSGKNRADTQRLHHILQYPVRPASPSDVLHLSGYPVGAVPPFGMGGEIPVLVDADLMACERVWASAGSIDSLVGITPDVLLQLSRGAVAVIKQE